MSKEPRGPREREDQRKSVRFYEHDGQVKMQADGDAMFLGRMVAKEYRAAVMSAIRDVAEFAVKKESAGYANAEAMVQSELPRAIERALPKAIQSITDEFVRDEIRARVRRHISNLDINLLIGAEGAE